HCNTAQIASKFIDIEKKVDSKTGETLEENPDYIKTGDYEGVVKEIKLRATVLNGYSSEKLVVPNSALTTGAVKNYTKGSKTKTSLEISPKTVEYREHA
ncbi:MAG: mechanosensitive ion channel domain-containing protein, partial [Candidatus Nanohalobium sp.]